MTGPRHRALLLACGRFDDPDLPPLRSPVRDAMAMRQVLTAEDNLDPYEVTVLVDGSVQDAKRAIALFLEGARRTDVNLLYLSCHGIQDEEGSLYFAFADTQHDMPDVTAVAADFIRHRLGTGRSRSTIVLIDCCFSGAFLQGMQAKSGRDAGVGALVRDLPDGSGVAVLTSSGATEVSLEDPGNRRDAARRGSYFTEAVLTGLLTGAADRDGDGRITVDELFSYASDRVADGPSRQKPRKFIHSEGEMVVARMRKHLPEPPPPAAPSATAETTLLGRVPLAPWPPLPPAVPQPYIGRARPPTPPAFTSPGPPVSGSWPVPASPARSPEIRRFRTGTGPAFGAGTARSLTGSAEGAGHIEQLSPADAANTGGLWRWRRPVVALVVTVVIFGGVATARALTSSPPLVAVPSVVGMTGDQADAKIRAQGLLPSASSALPAACTQGTVMKQIPDWPTSLEKGSVVTYTVCPIPQKAPVPKIIGMTEGDAKDVIEKAGFVAKVGEPVVNKKCTKDLVEEQRPEAEKDGTLGLTVTYRICKRPKADPTRRPPADRPKVPCIDGFTRDDAVTALGKVGLKAAVTPSEADGVVVGTTPPCGEVVSEGDTVTLTVEPGGTSPPVSSAGVP